MGCGLPPPHAAPASASIGGAPRSPPAEPLAHVCVYDMETGAATWRLPLLPPLDALLPLPPGAPPPPPPPPHGLAEDARGHGGGGGGGSAALRALAERVSCLAHAGVCALQFSPQVGDGRSVHGCCAKRQHGNSWCWNTEGRCWHGVRERAVWLCRGTEVHARMHGLL